MVHSPATIPRREPLYLHGLIALRNVSDKPITFTIDPDQKPFSVEATDASGKTAQSEFYAHARRLTPGSSPHVVIAPGQIVFLGPSGVSDIALGFHMDLSAGQWKLRARYRVDSAPAGGIPLWTGSIESAPAPLEVRDSRATSVSTIPSQGD